MKKIKYYRHYIPIVGFILSFTPGRLDDAIIFDSDKHFYASAVVQAISFVTIITVIAF